MDDSSIYLVRECLVVTLKIAAPIMAAGVAIGLVVSIVQSVTSIQDQTLTFVPKIIAMLIVAAAILPWIARRLIDYTADMLRLFG